MSQNNPNVSEILANSQGLEEMRRHFCKSYLQLAKMAFKKKHKRFPTLDDSQEVYDIYEAEWREYYIDKPSREKSKREKAKEVWRIGCKYKINVNNALCRFLEYKYSPFKEHDTPHPHFYDPIIGKYGYYKKCAANIMKEMGIEFIELHILDSGLLEEWSVWITTNKKHLPRYYKPKYKDYSHLAYSGVTDDF